MNYKNVGMEDDREKRGGGTITLIGVILVLLPILYVLSRGPVLWFAWKCHLPMGPLADFYSPLLLLSDYCEPLHRYNLWVDEIFLPPRPRGLA